MAQPHPDLIAATDGKRTQLQIELSLLATPIALAEPTWTHVTLGNAALRLADDTPTQAVALLIGAALEASMHNDDDQVALAMGAAVHLLKGITESQLGGVIQ